MMDWDKLRIFHAVATAESFGFGVAAISGIFTGCGFSPQMQGTDFSFSGSFTIDGLTVPLELAFPMAPADGVTTTLWVPDPVGDPALRTGTIDTLAYLGAIGSSGLSASGMEISYTITRTG